MDVIPLKIPEVKLVIPKISGDGRGWFSETFNHRDFAKAGLDAEFVQDNQSLSVQSGTIRGLHFQIAPYAQGKLVRVIRGAIFDVAVDVRASSRTYGQFVSAELTATNRTQIWIPPGFAHGFCTLEPLTEVFYKVTDYFAPDYELGLRWDDVEIGIDWPIDAADAQLSDKDRCLPRLGDLKPFSFAFA